ncbi:MAG: M16 family metallopeptidase [Fidelibacterota bacterium]
MKKCLILTLVSLTLLAAQGKIPSNFSVHTLDNGLQVLLIENPALPMVGVNVVVKTGSAYETFTTNGMSHMLEHLLFNGTTSRTQEELYTATDLIGGYNNANTGEYYTNYMMVTPSQFIIEGMEIQADMLFNSTLPEEKFAKEKGIVLEEIARSLGDPDVQRDRNLRAVLYAGHALSLPTLGTYSTIESLNRDDVMEYYKANYVPNNMILTAVGNFNAAEMLENIKSIYGPYAPGNVLRPENTELATGFHFSRNPSQPRVLYRSYGGDDVVEEMVYRLPDDFTREHITLLDETLDEQVETIEEKLKESYSPPLKSLKYTFYSSPVANYLVFTLKSGPEAPGESIAEALQKRLKALRFGISKQEIATLLTRERTQFLKSLEKPHMFGIYNAGRIAESEIDAIFTLLDPAYNDAAATLRTYRLTVPVWIMIQAPEAATADDTTAVVTRLFPADPGQSVLIVKQNSASQLLAIHYMFRHKAYFESQYGADAARILHDCFGQRMKSERMQKKAGRFGFTFTVNDNPHIPMDDIYLHPDFGYIRVEGLADDLEHAIGFLTDQINAYIPTEDEFRKAQDKFSEESENRHSSNRARKLFDETYQDVIFQLDPYVEKPDSLTYENLVKFTRDYFRPANQIISVVTPADPDQTAAYFTAEASTTPGPEIPQTAYEPALKTITKPVTIEKEAQGEQTYLFWGFIHDLDPADAPALKALSLVLGNKIVFDVREKQGMAYRMRAGIDMVQDKALFYIRLGTRPANADRLTPQFPGFFSTNMLQDVTDEDVTKAINMYLGRMMFRRLSSINQAYYLANSYYFHNDIDYDRDFHDQLRNITRDDIMAVGEKYLQTEIPISIIVR